MTMHDSNSITDDATGLWAAYRQAPGENALAALVEHYQPLVRRIVANMAIFARPEMDRDDFLQYAMMGLWNAIERFDSQRGILFNSYAATRIRGAVLDALRQHDRLTRTDRSLLKRLHECVHDYTGQHSHAPDEEELAQQAGITTERLCELTTRAKAILSLDNIMMADDEGGGASLSDHLVDESAPDPATLTANHEMGAQFRNAYRQLPPRQQKILYFYYYEDLTLKQIGEILELTEARICQLHANTLLLLRGMLSAGL